jgi:DNA-binding CsgD family transcriptional regulator
MADGSGRGPDLVGMAYAAALGDVGWSEVVGAISRAFDDATVLLTQGDPDDPASFAFVHNLDQSLLRGTGFSIREWFDPRRNPAMRYSLMVPPERSADIRCFVSEEVYLADPFWEQILTPQGVRYPRLLSLAREGGHAAGGFISQRNREIDAEVAQRLDRLLPHLARALRIGNEVGRARHVESDMGGALEALALGLVVVDRRFGISATNRVAEAILAEADGLRAVSGRLHVACPQCRRQLATEVARHSASSPAARGDRLVGVPRASIGPAYVLRVLPSAPATGFGAARHGNASIIISDPLRGGRVPDGTIVKRAYGLTAAESAVAALIPFGLSKRKVAAQLGVSENTVKTHLKAVYDKLGVRSQAELVRVLMI